MIHLSTFYIIQRKMRYTLLFMVVFAGIVNSKESINREFGNPEKSIATLDFKSTGKTKIHLVFYIEKFPYSQHVNLCSELPIYSNLKAVTTDKNGKVVDKVFESSSNTCNSTFTVQSFFDNQVYFDMDFKTFNEFKIAEFHGHTNYIPSTRHQRARTILTDRESQTLSTYYEGKELVRQVAAEFNLKE